MGVVTTRTWHQQAGRYRRGEQAVRRSEIAILRLDRGRMVVRWAAILTLASVFTVPGARAHIDTPLTPLRFLLAEWEATDTPSGDRGGRELELRDSAEASFSHLNAARRGAQRKYTSSRPVRKSAGEQSWKGAVTEHVPGRTRYCFASALSHGVYRGVSAVRTELAVAVSVGPAVTSLSGDAPPFVPWMSREASAPLSGADQAQQQQQ